MPVQRVHLCLSKKNKEMTPEMAASVDDLLEIIVLFKTDPGMVEGRMQKPTKDQNTEDEELLINWD